jgi:hypothetical protein
LEKKGGELIGTLATAALYSSPVKEEEDRTPTSSASTSSVATAAKPLSQGRKDRFFFYF